MDDRAVLYVGDQAPRVGRARRARARLPARPGARAAHATPASASSPRPSPRRSTPTSAPACGRWPWWPRRGATNTGAIDPLGGLAAVCREHGVWLHVDAAYGGFAALTERGRARSGRARARRLGDARSAQVALPADRVRLAARPRRAPAASERSRSSRTTCSDAAGREDEVDFGDLGLQLNARLPRAEGLAVGQPLRRRRVPRLRSTTRSTWPSWRGGGSPRTTGSRRSPPGELGITCFRRRVDGRRGGGGERQRGADRRLRGERPGPRVLHPRCDGRYAVRLCVLNHTTRAEDVEAALDFFASAPGRPGRRRRRGRRRT